MSNQYYQLSTDYDLADKHLKEGATLAAWLWKPNKQLYLFSITDGELFIDGTYPPSDFTYEKYLVQFLLPIPDPTYELKADLTEVQQQCSKLQHSLTQALNESDELRAKSQDLQSELNGLKCHTDVNRNQTQAYEAIIKGAQESLKDCFDKNEELETQNTLANETLTAIAKQLGFESFADDEVMIAIENLLATKACNEVKDREIKILQETLERTNSLHETQIHRRNIASQAQIESINALREQRDNLNQSHSDRLSELTSIMRMVQALEDTPQDKIDGAIYLIKRVLYDAICRLDPSQSWDA